MDLIGNRTKIYPKSATATDYLHNPVNEYTKVGGNDYQYDAAGNLTKDTNYRYYWDYENRLTKVKSAADFADVAEYAYDAKMRRVEKTDYTQAPSVTAKFYQDNWSDIEERDGNDAVTATYVNGPTIDNYITMERGGNTYWYCQSPIVGNVAALLSSSGAIQEGYKYTGYGTSTILTGAGNDGLWFTADDATTSVSALGNPFTFTGRRLDSETMRMYFRNRIYRTDDGVFISCDPLGYVEGQSAYLAYFAPVRTDPLGLWGVDVHRGATTDWAVASGMPALAADLVGEADNAVDSGNTSWLPHWLPFIGGDQRYHFNRNPGREDTRLMLSNRLFSEAKVQCKKSKGNDNPDEAARLLGASLHPLQDWVAHGDYGIGGIVGVHNLFSPQANLPAMYGSTYEYPDDTRLDARGGPDGRPAGRGIYIVTLAGVDQSFAWYEPGGKRIALTHKKTAQALKDFRNFVKSSGGCACKTYFGVQ